MACGGLDATIDRFTVATLWPLVFFKKVKKRRLILSLSALCFVMV